MNTKTSTAAGPAQASLRVLGNSGALRIKASPNSTCRPQRSTMLFWMPSQRHSIVAMLRRDLAGAGIIATWDTGEVVDFHSFRCTAITWWLDVYGLSSKRVQQLARLKTLRLVERYSRKFRLTDTAWLSNAPKLGNEPPTPTVGQEAAAG